MKSLLRDEKIGYVGFDNVDKLPFVIEKSDLQEIDKTQFRIIKNVNFEGSYLNGPIYLSLFPTLNCNKNCNFCYYSSQLNKGNMNEITMNINTAKKVIDFCYQYGLLLVNIIGGEPLLPHVWPITSYLIERLLKKSITVSLLTNGINLYMVADEISKFYKLYMNFFKLIVSTSPFDFNSEHYPKIVSGLRIAQKNNLRISINTIVLKGVHKIYIDYFNRLLTDFRDIIININLLYPRLNDNERMKISEYIMFCNKIKEKVKIPMEIEIPFPYMYNNFKNDISQVDKLNIGCGVARRTIAVSPNGKFYACDCFINQDDFELGDINNSLQTLWLNAINLKKRYNFKITPDSCKGGCDYYEICDGCLAEKIEGKNPVCEYI